jgi:hypothetical protein
MTNVRRMLTLVLVTLLASYLFIALAAFTLQRRLLFPAPEGAAKPSLEGATLLEIPRVGHGPVYAVHFAAPEGAPTLVHFHGNAEDLESASSSFGGRLSRAGFGYFAV